MPTNLLLETNGAVVRITLNRPDVLNSFTRAMAREFTTEISRIAQDASIARSS